MNAAYLALTLFGRIKGYSAFIAGGAGMAYAKSGFEQESTCVICAYHTTPRRR